MEKHISKATGKLSQITADSLQRSPQIEIRTDEKDEKIT